MTDINYHLRNMYDKYGVKHTYQLLVNTYVNPHQNLITQLFIKYLAKYIKHNSNILDLAAGDGLITKILFNYFSDYYLSIDGIDAYLSDLYTSNTGIKCMNLSFEDIALGKLNISKKYDIIICSYAYHLLNKSWIYNFLLEMTFLTKIFIIISPTKNIYINHPYWQTIFHIRENHVDIFVLKSINQIILKS